MIARLRQELGHTFVIVTHDPSIALIADRVVNMADGRIIGIENPSAVSSEAETVDAADDEIPIISGIVDE